MWYGKAANSILDARRIEEPWPHYRADNVWEPEVYEKLLNIFPEPSLMEGDGRRKFFWLIKYGVVLADRGDYFWDQAHRGLAALAAALEVKVGVLGRYIGSELTYDTKGYYLGPHTDDTNKLITCLFYLPATADNASEGTRLYTGPPDPKGRGHKLYDPAYKYVCTVPYVPNSMLFFKRTDVSFHAVAQTSVTRRAWALDVFN